jgi:hypothetical protein
MYVTRTPAQVAANPPDPQQQAREIVLEQAELLSQAWAVA